MPQQVTLAFTTMSEVRVSRVFSHNDEEHGAGAW